MPSVVLRIVGGLLLIVHGFAHWQITTGWGSRPSASSWLLRSESAAAMAGDSLWSSRS